MSKNYDYGLGKFEPGVMRGKKEYGFVPNGKISVRENHKGLQTYFNVLRCIGKKSEAGISNSLSEERDMVVVPR